MSRPLDQTDTTMGPVKTAGPIKKHKRRFEISKQMDAEEVTRLKQLTGLADMFKNATFSKSWKPGTLDYEE